MNFSNHEFNDTPEPRRPGGVHNELLADLKAWLDGELAAPRVWFVRAHLCFCPACREEVKWLKRLGEDMRDLERAVPSPRLRARIMAALPDTPPGRPVPVPARNSYRLRYGATVAFACACMAFAAIIFNHQAHTRIASAHQTAALNGTVSNSGPRESAPAERSNRAPLTLPQTVDPNSQEADRMLARWLKDQEFRQSRDIAKNRANWTNLVAKLRAAVHSGRTDEPLHLAVAVPNVQSAESTLTAWAKSVGGSASDSSQSGPGSSAVAPVVPTNEAPPRSTEPAEISSGRVVTLRVGAAKVAMLEPVLGRLGAWHQTAAAASLRTGGPASSGPAATRSDKPNTGAVVQVDPTQEPGAQITNPAAVHPGSGDQAAGRDGGAAQVTLQIRLSSLESAVP